jgi:hypothetical protein
MIILILSLISVCVIMELLTSSRGECRSGSRKLRGL